MTAYLGLGSNLGDRLAALRSARESLAAVPGLAVRASSRLYETDPVGGPPGQGSYLNAVVRVVTSLSPEDLLARCQRIETALGRRRGERWAARTLDIDLLLYADRQIDTPGLVVPHPRLTERRFVLAPLCDLAADDVPPRQGRTVGQLLEALGEASAVTCLGAW